MSAMASQINSLTIFYPTVYSGADQGKYQSSASPAFVRRIHRWSVNSPHKGPVTRKMFPFDDVIIWMSVNYIAKNDDWLLQWRRISRCLKSPVAILFVQQIVWFNNKGSIKPPHYWPFMREAIGEQLIPTQRSSCMESVYISWRHHYVLSLIVYLLWNYYDIWAY